MEPKFIKTYIHIICQIEVIKLKEHTEIFIKSNQFAKMLTDDNNIINDNTLIIKNDDINVNHIKY